MVRDTVLFCQSCKEEVSLKKSNLNTRISSNKYKTKKEKIAKISMNERDIAEALTKFDDKHHPKGETLPTSTRVFRVKVGCALLKSGKPLHRLEYFREVFEEAGFSLRSHSHIRQLIPFILEEENTTILKELMGKDVSIFDGTTRDGEALVLLLRFVDEWELKVRLVRFHLVKTSVCGDELARIVIEVLHRKLSVLQGQLLAAMRDREAVNTCALKTVCSLSRRARSGLHLPFP